MNLNQVGGEDVRCLEDEAERGEPNHGLVSANYSEGQEIICEIIERPAIVDTLLTLRKIANRHGDRFRH